MRPASPAASSSDPETLCGGGREQLPPGRRGAVRALRERKLVRFNAPREESYDETGLVNALETLASNRVAAAKDSEKMRGLVKDMHRDPRLKGGG